MNILAAMDDPKLFGPFFQGSSWAAWRAFLAGLTAAPLDDAAQALWAHHTGRKTASAGGYDEAALIVGRRGGKSRVLATIATYLAAFIDYRPHLAPGEVGTLPIIAADRKQARAIHRYAVGLFRSIPMLSALVEAETADSITLNKRVVIEIFTASFRVTRGYTLIGALLDEIAFWRSDETAANPDEEILGALRPGLSTIPGAKLLMASSPYAKRGVLYGTFRRHWGVEDSPVLVWRGTTREMNPRISQRIIDEAMERDPARAASEYLAQFRDDIASFVAREVVDACTIPSRHELPRASRFSYRAFVDPSGGSADSMTLAVAHLENGKAILDLVREVKPPFSPESVVKDFAATLRDYGVRTVTGDRYAGEWPRERFREHGVTYEPSEKSKADIYRDLLPALNSHKVELLDLPRLTTQLCGLERRTARGGRDSIDHAPGAHDDVANAAAGALLNVSARGGYDSSMSWV